MAAISNLSSIQDQVNSIKVECAPKIINAISQAMKSFLEMEGDIKELTLNLINAKIQNEITEADKKVQMVIGPLLRHTITTLMNSPDALKMSFLTNFKGNDLAKVLLTYLLPEAKNIAAQLTEEQSDPKLWT